MPDQYDVVDHYYKQEERIYRKLGPNQVKATYIVGTGTHVLTMT